MIASTMFRRSVFLILVLSITLLNDQAAWADSIALAQTVQAGQMAVYAVDLRNETTSDHEYALAQTGLPDGLVISFSQGGPVLDTISVPARSAASVDLRVETTAATSIGSYAGELVATRDDGAILRMPLSLVVENTYAMKIVSQNVNLSTFSGKEFTFDVSAANTGAAAVTNAALQVDAPAKWLVQTDPAQVESLEPGAGAAFHVRVVVPPSQIAIDQPLKLSVVSDQAASPQSTITVRVQKSPSYLLAAAVLMIAAVGAVLVYFRRKGRR